MTSSVSEIDEDSSARATCGDSIFTKPQTRQIPIPNRGKDEADAKGNLKQKEGDLVNESRTPLYLSAPAHANRCFQRMALGGLLQNCRWKIVGRKHVQPETGNKTCRSAGIDFGRPPSNLTAICDIPSPRLKSRGLLLDKSSLVAKFTIQNGTRSRSNFGCGFRTHTPNMRARHDYGNFAQRFENSFANLDCCQSR